MCYCWTISFLYTWVLKHFTICLSCFDVSMGWFVGWIPDKSHTPYLYTVTNTKSGITGTVKSMAQTQMTSFLNRTRGTAEQSLINPISPMSDIPLPMRCKNKKSKRVLKAEKRRQRKRADLPRKCKKTRQSDPTITTPSSNRSTPMPSVIDSTLLEASYSGAHTQSYHFDDVRPPHSDFNETFDDRSLTELLMSDPYPKCQSSIEHSIGHLQSQWCAFKMENEVKTDENQRLQT